MATNAPSYRCMFCGGHLEWEVVPHDRMPGEPVRFGPTDWRQLPHTCPPGAVEQWMASAFDRGREQAKEPFFKKITS